MCRRIVEIRDKTSNLISIYRDILTTLTSVKYGNWIELQLSKDQGDRLII